MELNVDLGKGVKLLQRYLRPQDLGAGSRFGSWAYILATATTSAVQCILDNI